METKDFLRELSKKYNLGPGDFYKQKNQGWVIITRKGIDKIWVKSDIQVEYDVIKSERDHCIVKAKAFKAGRSVQTFGEANTDNCKNAYPMAMAEKRAYARAVLKIEGAYAEGIFSEDESDEFKK